MLRCSSALLSVANCLPPYLRYTFETCESSIAGVTVRGLPGTTKNTKKDAKNAKNAKKKTTETRRHGERQLEKAQNPWRTRGGDTRRRRSARRRAMRVSVPLCLCGFPSSCVFVVFVPSWF